MWSRSSLFKTKSCALGRRASGYSRCTMAHHCVQRAAEAKVRMYGGELVKSLWGYTSASHSSRCGGRERGLSSRLPLAHTHGTTPLRSIALLPRWCHQDSACMGSLATQIWDFRYSSSGLRRARCWPSFVDVLGRVRARFVFGSGCELRIAAL
jgi:hypothetical protein